jgi:hypothetical protein
VAIDTKKSEEHNTSSLFDITQNCMNDENMLYVTGPTNFTFQKQNGPQKLTVNQCQIEY